jgi:hypothetical protein
MYRDLTLARALKRSPSVSSFNLIELINGVSLKTYLIDRDIYNKATIPLSLKRRKIRT